MFPIWQCGGNPCGYVPSISAARTLCRSTQRRGTGWPASIRTGIQQRAAWIPHWTRLLRPGQSRQRTAGEVPTGALVRTYRATPRFFDRVIRADTPPFRFGAETLDSVRTVHTIKTSLARAVLATPHIRSDLRGDSSLRQPYDHRRDEAFPARDARQFVFTGRDDQHIGVGSVRGLKPIRPSFSVKHPSTDRIIRRRRNPILKAQKSTG